MNSLNDGHHYWSSCYTSYFKTIHEFPITALDIENNGKVEIYLVPDLPVYAYEAGFAQIYERNGLNTSALAGAQVLSIDGMNAWDYLDGPASKRIGSYQDPAQRFNALLASYSASEGAFGRIAGGFTSTPNLTQSSITMIVKPVQGPQTNVVVPWITRLPRPWNFSSGKDL